RWCSSCHLVERGQKGPTTEATPFATIAKRPGFDAADCLGDLEPSLVGRRQEIRTRLLDDTKWRVHLAANIDPRMTAGTALIHEELQSFLLLGSERVRITPQILVEWCIGRDESCFKGRNCGHHIRHGDTVLVGWKRR